MKYLLDTVTISETSKQILQPGMQTFYSSQDPSQYCLSAVTIGELTYGYLRLPIGKRRESLMSWLTQVEQAFDGRILPVDQKVSRQWGELRVATKLSGYTIDLPDLLIAATAIRHDLTVVTRNVRDFAPTGCKVLNPWENDSP